MKPYNYRNEPSEIFKLNLRVRRVLTSWERFVIIDIGRCWGKFLVYSRLFRCRVHCMNEPISFYLLLTVAQRLLLPSRTMQRARRRERKMNHQALRKLKRKLPKILGWLLYSVEPAASLKVCYRTLLTLSYGICNDCTYRLTWLCTLRTALSGRFMFMLWLTNYAFNNLNVWEGFVETKTKL